MRADFAAGLLSVVLAAHVTIAQTTTQPTEAAAPSAQPSPNDRRRAVDAYDEGVRLIERGEFDRAIVLLQRAIQLMPTPDRNILRSGSFRGGYYPYYYLSKALFSRARYAEALTELQKSLAHRELESNPTLDVDRVQMMEQSQLYVTLNVDRIGSGDEVQVDPEFLGDLVSATDLAINGTPARVAQVDASAQTARFLGSMRQGLNTITTGVGNARREATFWLENRKLAKFELPYRNSYAVVIAIGDYERRKLPGAVPTGYDSVPGMVERAQQLVKVLTQIGFPSENIIPLFDTAATSANIESTLRNFWTGGKFAHADRVFVYYGGHGDVLRTTGTPFLVSYDYDSRRPTATGVVLQNLTQVHAREIVANHVMFAIDACHAGLAAPRGLGGGLDEAYVKRFHTLSVIRAAVESKARNMIVAGTGDQRALYDNGGIFTSALIQGLSGAADSNRDGLIQFRELGLFVDNQVVAKAAASGVAQKPDPYSLFGDGEFMFLLGKP